MKRIPLTFFIALLSGCALSTTQQALETYGNPAFRKTIPKAGPKPILRAPQGTREILPNGMTLITVEKRNLPLIHTQVVFKSGSAADPQKFPGLAGFTSAILKTGTTTRNAQALSDEVETRGSFIGSDVSEDTIGFSFTALTENHEAVLEILGDILQNPNFSEAEIERQRAQRLTALAQGKDDPRQIVRRVFKRSIFGTHPYGHNPLGTEESLQAIGSTQLRDFYSEHIRPANAAIIVVGDISKLQIKKSIERTFGKWKSSDGITSAPETPSSNASGVFLVDKPGAAQSQLRIGHLGVSRSHPDYFAIVLCNAILGGQFNSRINMNLREDKGYTYGARSFFSFKRGVGAFGVATGVNTDVTAPAISEILNELETIRTQDVSPKELSNAQNYYSLSLPGYFQTVNGIASMFSNIYTYDLPMNYYQELPHKLGKVTIADIRRVAQSTLKPENLAIVVVGDKNTVAPTLKELGRGKVKLLDANGQPL